MRDFMFRILYTAQDGSKTLHYPDDKTFMIGLDGKVYENYGTKEKSVWEVPFDVAEPPIIQQATGIRDRNQMMIYEDDSLMFLYSRHTGKVLFKDGTFLVKWDIVIEDGWGYSILGNLGKQELEILSYKK